MILRGLLLLICFPVYATVFQMQPVEQQIQESDGIIVGHYLRSQSIKLDDGAIATQMIFKMNKEIGMQSEFFGMDEIIVHYPGGQIGEETMRVSGVPSFVPGEKLVIMIKAHQDRYWGMNLGFGSFKVINYGNEKLIVNTLFPEDRKVGQMKMSDFERSVRKIKGSRMKVVYNPEEQRIGDQKAQDRMPAALEEEGKNRAIASKTDQSDNGETQEGINPFWLLFFLATAGALFRLSKQGSVR